MKDIIKNIFSHSNLWAAVIPLQILGIYSIVHLFYVDVNFLFLLVGLICIEIIGVSAGLHRWASHRSFSVNNFVKFFMLWFGALACQGSPIFWATIHRSYHHRYADSDKDPHNPAHGFWHSYMLWMFTIKEDNFNTKRITDLLKDPMVVFLHKWYIPILWITNILIAFISLELWLYAVILPAFITFHKFNLQTSIVHYKNLGYRNFDIGDNSVTIPWLWPITLGEAWHNNHHANPSNSKIGGVKWWELDPTFWIITLIRKKENV